MGLEIDSSCWKCAKVAAGIGNYDGIREKKRFAMKMRAYGKSKMVEMAGGCRN